MKVGDLVIGLDVDIDHKLIKSVLFVIGAFFVSHAFGIIFGVIS